MTSGELTHYGKLILNLTILQICRHLGAIAFVNPVIFVDDSSAVIESPLDVLH